jgi:tetratricopeptide (TPR) repeat protein
MTRSHGRRPRARSGSRRRGGRLALVAQVVLVAALVVLVVARVIPGWRHHVRSERGRPGAPADRGPALSDYAGSASCRSCHPVEYQRWWSSHHALAERSVDARDRPAFDPPRRFDHGTQHTDLALARDRPRIVALGAGDRTDTMFVARVIGVSPLRQFLIPAPGGRWQTLEASYDPARDQWFDVYGAEDRRPGEWGHWTGRGMNWNSMCATCHNTGLVKGYDAGADTFATRMAEPSVGCEACHGPMADHVGWRTRHRDTRAADPTARPFSADQWLGTCATCHSRRAELTGRFVPGDAYDDHYTLSIVDGSEMFHPDGQVHEEDYEYSAFLGSRMHAAGVGCGDCHEPHSARPRAPGNLLCMRCHDGSRNGAPVIDPVTHAHHPLDPAYHAGMPDTAALAGRDPETTAKEGGECVNCHMPQTFYMQRHRRHDHGFTIPDPVLTERFGIPNACNRCHPNRDASWARGAVERWYGARMERPTRQRVTILARARGGDPGVMDSLATRLGSESASYWRAVAAAMLGAMLRAHPGGEGVSAALVGATHDTSPLVRAYVATALDPLADAGDATAHAALVELARDPARNVRHQAAWALRATLAPGDPATSETRGILDESADEPLGRMRIGAWQLARGAPDSALGSYRVAAEWDTNSAPIRHELAIVLARLGRNDEAVVELLAACRHDPQVAEYPFKLGLAWNEVGRRDLAISSFQHAVRLDPAHARAWYDLGLALDADGRSTDALHALDRAGGADPLSPEAPYARATILARLGKREAARGAAAEALTRQPGYRPALELLTSLR